MLKKIRAICGFAADNQAKITLLDSLNQDERATNLQITIIKPIHSLNLQFEEISRHDRTHDSRQNTKLSVYIQIEKTKSHDA